MDGQPQSSKPSIDAGLRLKIVKRPVIDIAAPGMRQAVADAVQRINQSEEAEHIQAELDSTFTENWKLLPE